jgi:GTP pyrophosphokinase
MVPFNTVLKNGDRIEIITSSKQHPKVDWLDIVKTSRAQNKIKAFLNAEQRELSLKAGTDLLTRALRQYGYSFNKIFKSKKLDELAPKYKLRSGIDILAAIGHGKLDETDIVQQLIPDDDKKNKSIEMKESAFEKVIRKVKWHDDGIIIDGVDNLLIHFAKCCNPLPGEPIIGYISRGRGIIIQKKGCPKAAFLEKERQTKVQWSNKAVSQREVKIEVLTEDRTGILASLSNSFKLKGINITSAVCKTEGIDKAVNIFNFMVQDLTQLNDLIKSLKQTKGVFNVRRL